MEINMLVKRNRTVPCVTVTQKIEVEVAVQTVFSTEVGACVLASTGGKVTVFHEKKDDAGTFAATPELEMTSEEFKNYVACLVNKAREMGLIPVEKVKRPYVRKAQIVAPEAVLEPTPANVSSPELPTEVTNIVNPEPLMTEILLENAADADALQEEESVCWGTLDAPLIADAAYDPFGPDAM